MIEKLKNAGLGWRECDTQSLSEKLGMCIHIFL